MRERRPFPQKYYPVLCKMPHVAKTGRTRGTIVLSRHQAGAVLSATCASYPALVDENFPESGIETVHAIRSPSS
jgi:hypothetical protein